MAPKIVKGEYIETDTGNKVSRRSQIHGTQNIILGGRVVIQAESVIRGDLHRTSSAPPPSSSSSSTTTAPGPPATTTTSNLAISIGRYTLLSPRTVLHPPSKPTRGTQTYYPLKIGEHCLIAPDAVVEAAVLGSYVQIGKGAVVGKFAILKDYVRVLEGCVVPQGMVVPSFSVVAGRPGRVVGECGVGGVEGWDLREAYKKV
ncbi:MAG: hypothetical protein M1832_002279 [Thelocarpon impressellum]|nr:MAG: hypothetical protein M1832_002279 [Thelocarpon impressellum]